MYLLPQGLNFRVLTFEMSINLDTTYVLYTCTSHTVYLRLWFFLTDFPQKIS